MGIHCYTPVNYDNMVALCSGMDWGLRCIFLQIILGLNHPFLRFLKKNAFRVKIRVYKIV